MKNLVGYRSEVRTVLSSKEKVLEATVSNSILDIDKKCNNEFRIFIYLSSTHVLMKTIVFLSCTTHAFIKGKKEGKTSGSNLADLKNANSEYEFKGQDLKKKLFFVLFLFLFVNLKIFSLQSIRRRFFWI